MLVVVNTLFGRMDQVLANLNVLYCHVDLEMFLLLEESIMFVLGPVSHGYRVLGSRDLLG